MWMGQEKRFVSKYQSQDKGGKPCLVFQPVRYVYGWPRIGRARPHNPNNLSRLPPQMSVRVFESSFSSSISLK